MLIRFPLSAIADLYVFRFETVEPLMDDALAQTGIGCCDYGFCDAEFLNMVAYATDQAAAVKTILKSLQPAGLVPESIWFSEKGVAKNQIWPG